VPQKASSVTEVRSPTSKTVQNSIRFKDFNRCYKQSILYQKNMDSIFDNFSSSLVGGEKTEQERIDAVLHHPLFMTSMKDDLQYTDTIEAIQSLVFDGTPQGNIAITIKKLQKISRSKEMHVLWKERKSLKMRLNSILKALKPKHLIIISTLYCMLIGLLFI
jgi:hypothetical protein